MKFHVIFLHPNDQEAECPDKQNVNIKTIIKKTKLQHGDTANWLQCRWRQYQFEE